MSPATRIHSTKWLAIRLTIWLSSCNAPLVITAETSTLCGKLTVTDPGISDHKLIAADLQVGRLKSIVRQYRYRNVKTVDVAVFADRLRRQPVYTDPADSVDKFAGQLEQSVVEVLDELAPLKTCSKRCGRRCSRWLSEPVVTAKRKRCRLERRWNRTRRDADRVAYRSACREANAEINKSRQSFYQQRLTEAADNHGAQWKIVRELLHSDDDLAVMEPAEAKRLCTQFSRLFISKLQRIASEIETRLSAAALSVQTLRRAPSPATLH